MNSKGLTFFEWYRTANFCRAKAMDGSIARALWEQGEDPTEWAIWNCPWMPYLKAA
jgi:hypothetical protein